MGGKRLLLVLVLRDAAGHRRGVRVTPGLGHSCFYLVVICSRFPLLPSRGLGRRRLVSERTLHGWLWGVTQITGYCLSGVLCSAPPGADEALLRPGFWTRRWWGRGRVNYGRQERRVVGRLVLRVSAWSLSCGRVGGIRTIRWSSKRVLPRGFVMSRSP